MATVDAARARKRERDKVELSRGREVCIHLEPCGITFPCAGWAAVPVIRVPESSRAGIVNAILANDTPHSYGAALAGQPRTHEPCHCLICSLPRGPAWGEYELERRITAMGADAHASLRAIGVWLGARTGRDG